MCVSKGIQNALIFIYSTATALDLFCYCAEIGMIILIMAMMMKVNGKIHLINLK